ncbi:MAG: FKBP-type peptidyl-prolyl cis-trans isomerase [Oligoflexales bacterium]
MSQTIKAILVSAAVLGTSSQVLAEGKGAPLKTDAEKASYGIGQQIGRGLKSQGVAVNVDIMAGSIKDVLEGRPSRLSDQEIQTALTKLQEDMQKKMAEQAEKNKEVGAKYLEENKKKSGVKSTKSGLQYKVITAGKGDSPKAESKVKVHYRGTLIDGSEFDSSYKRNEPAVFPVGGVIAGWTEALKLMKPGAKWELTIPSDLAYGSRGRPGIPANSVLNFTVELVEIMKDKKPETPAAKPAPKKK